MPSFILFEVPIMRIHLGFLIKVSPIGVNQLLFAQLSELGLHDIIELMYSHLEEYYQELGGLVGD
nr:hypothetical protein [uncultured Sphaerochaeta sp.]